MIFAVRDDFGSNGNSSLIRVYSRSFAADCFWLWLRSAGPGFCLQLSGNSLQLRNLSTIGERPIISAGGQLRLASWLCGATIFLSAFLLFLVQPILGKIVLPWFGGSAGVWAACLVYFQASLLAGYAYAHWLRRWLSPQRQLLVHAVLLAVSLFFLPILPSTIWRQTGSADPALRILGLLASTIGLPCLLISSTSPLVQAWYADLNPGPSAYRLYALSNLGSLLGLVCFPLLVEPHLRTTTQAREWSVGYVVFAALCALTAWYTFRNRSAMQYLAQTPYSGAGLPPLEPVTRSSWILWMALAACGSGLLLAVTNHLSQNVAPIPLLWILPLSIYLLSFVLCFDAGRIYRRFIWIPLMLAGLGAMAYVMYSDSGNPRVRVAVPVFLACLFACCMVCHGELVRCKPPANRLTAFYLMVSAGGVLGGLFVALIAPHIFKTYAELPVLMGVCAALIALVVWKPLGTLRPFLAWPLRLGMVACAIGLSWYLGQQHSKEGNDDQLQVRNFYGALRVQNQTVDGEKDGPEQPARVLIHGTIEHGAQMLAPADRDEPTSYYVRASGVGLAQEFLHIRVHMRVGVIGLGAGVIASYCRPEDFYRYYEINPLVEPIAREEFTFLSDCAGDLKVNLGDARLTLEGQPPQNFDLLAVDAFSGDAVPTHLLTREAFIEYFRHIKADGILAIHVSNRYLKLAPVVANIAEELHKPAMVVEDDGSQGKDAASSTWVLLSSTASVFDDQAFNVEWIKPAKPDPKLRLWTDDYSNLLQVMDFGKEKEKKDQ